MSELIVDTNGKCSSIFNVSGKGMVSKEALTIKNNSASDLTVSWLERKEGKKPTTKSEAVPANGSAIINLELFVGMPTILKVGEQMTYVLYESNEQSR